MASLSVIADAANKSAFDIGRKVISFITDIRDISDTATIHKSTVITVAKIFGEDSKVTKGVSKIYKIALEAKFFSWAKNLIKFKKGILDYMKLKDVTVLIKFANLAVVSNYLWKVLVDIGLNTIFRMKHKIAAARLKAINKFLTNEANAHAQAFKDVLLQLGKGDVRKKTMTAVKIDNGKKVAIELSDTDLQYYTKATGLVFLWRVLGGTFNAFWNPKSVQAVALANTYSTYWQFARYTIWKFLPDVAVAAITVLSGVPLGTIVYSIFVSTVLTVVLSIDHADKSYNYRSANSVVIGLNKLIDVLAKNQNKLNTKGKFVVEYNDGEIKRFLMVEKEKNPLRINDPSLGKYLADQFKLTIFEGRQDGTKFVIASSAYTTAELENLKTELKAVNKVKKGMVDKSEDYTVEIEMGEVDYNIEQKVESTQYIWRDYVNACKEYIQEKAI